MDPAKKRLAADCVLGGRPGRGWRRCSPLWLLAGGSGFGLCGGSDLEACLLMRWWGLGALAVCRARQGLPVGFLLLRCLVGFTVESLSLLYLLVVSWFICFGGGALVGWGSFMRTGCLCVLVHIWVGGEVGAVRPVKALQWNILLAVPRRCFFC